MITQVGKGKLTENFRKNKKKIFIYPLLTDICNAQYRILDHRVFVNGEIEAFLNNFESQRNDSEIESLFKVTETVGALKYEISDRCINLGATNLKDISTELKSLLNKVDNLVNDLQKSKEVRRF